MCVPKMCLYCHDGFCVVVATGFAVVVELLLILLLPILFLPAAVADRSSNDQICFFVVVGEDYHEKIKLF